MATTPGYWPVRYWPETDFYYWSVGNEYWPVYGAVVYELLITEGYWPTTYFPTCYWIDNYWPEYAVVAGGEHIQVVIIG